MTAEIRLKPLTFRLKVRRSNHFLKTTTSPLTSAVQIFMQVANLRLFFPFFFFNFFHASADFFVRKIKFSMSSMQWFKIC